ncbi:MAG: type I 3-dehydroquinate dehydratase [Planctomycetes bacterium]|nr:type I 3-dehydroquinate dehydratase [Planctomycetota bacterium]
MAVIAERTAARVRSEAERAAPLCDLLEIRLDHLEGTPSPAALFPGLPRPAIATCRRAAEGGLWLAGEEDRRLLLEESVAAGASFVDFEAGAGPAPGRGRAAILRSLHLPEGSAEPPAEALRRLEAEEGDLLKLVLPAGDAPAALEALRLLRERPPGARPLAAFGAGPRGAVTRLLQPVVGGALLYAAPRPGREAVPGMPSLPELEKVYGVRSLRTSTAFYGLLGRTLLQSVSPAMVNGALRAAGRDAVYLPVPCLDGDRTAALLLELGAAGLAFTAPFKAIPLWMASLTEAVAAHGVAANTLFRRGGIFVAANTDGPAARRLAREALGTLEGKVALVLGSGGTARAVAAALKEERCRVHLLGRNTDKTAAAAATTGALAGRPGERTVDLLVNATPVGMWPSAPRDPAEDLAPGIRARIRLDAVYNPRDTAFLAGPAEVRIRGVEMLAGQAVDQLRLFGVPRPDGEAMLRTADAELAGRERRIVLLGMRGAGKTVVGEALAAVTGRRLLDTDRLVEERAGSPVASLFAEGGEEAFRALEREAVARALRPTGTVVALGGGAVVGIAGFPPGTLAVWLRARVETLAERIRGSGRPSLRGKPPEEEVEELLREREPIYRSLAGFVLDTDDLRPAEAAAEVLSALGSP